MTTCPCSHPANARREGVRPSPMQVAGREGCRRCRGTGRARYCWDCAGTGGVLDTREVVPCATCAGVGYVPEAVAA